jgi:hypothetical protein
MSISCTKRFLVVDSTNNVMKPAHVGYIGPDNPDKGSGSFRGDNAEANARRFAAHLVSLAQNKGQKFYLLTQVACITPSYTEVRAAGMWVEAGQEAPATAPAPVLTPGA